MPAQQPVSIQDVANEAGVSTATVSRVLNNGGLVAPATAARVQEAIRKLGYRPNLFAQGLMTRRSHVIGIALPDIHGEFYSELLRGADAEARRLGYHLLVSSEAHNSADQARTGGLGFSLIDGLAVMIAEPNEQLWREAKASMVPLVVLDSDLTGEGADSILVDNATGTAQATRHLLESVAPERCFFVGGPVDNYDTQQRASSFLEVLRHAGGKPRADQVVYGHYSLAWGQEWAGARAAAGELAGAGVLAGNDEIALGILHTAQEHEIEVPGSLRLIGFDDTRLASLVRPTLSTVRVPLTEVGAAAMRMLVERIGDEAIGARRLSLPTALIVRESSAVRR